MAGTYPELRALLEFFVESADDHLAGITDDQLHNLVNQSSKTAAQAKVRIDVIDAATARGR